MSERVFKCAGCGSPEPFGCECSTNIAYADEPFESAWKSDILKRNSFQTRFRWWLFKHISALGWRVCPEPYRTKFKLGIGTWEDVNARIAGRKAGDKG